MESRNRPKILIADDHMLVAEACKKLLQPEFEVVGVVSDGRALMRAAAELRPDVAIVDVAMPLLNGLDAGERIKHKNRAIQLIFLTMNVAPDVAAEAFRRGASGYVLKHCAAEELIVAVRKVLRGDRYLSPLIARDTVDLYPRTDAGSSEKKHISGRQSEVLQLLAEGKCMKEVAYILQLKPGTVAFHKYKTMEVLGIRSNAELIEYAIRHHMVVE